MDFKNIETKFRPIPFWSWNDELNIDETKRQVRLMNEQGIGGVFMHARGGLKTPYMGDEWFKNVEACIKECEKTDMLPWAYDENGWPSGFSDGKVNGMGAKYQQKYLRIEKGEKQTDCTICNVSGYHLYYELNPFYVDVLDENVVAEFIKLSYEPYYEKYKNDIKGFFTDEPQISRNGIPWSLTLPEEYKKVYNEEIYDVLPQLFFPIGNYKESRIKFWKLITDLFSKNYMKQIYDWCLAHNLEYTGHLVLEESLEEQLTTNGACMPHYEYFTIPGMDWLGRDIKECLTHRQVSSVAQQLSKKQVLAEDFALCGHNVSFEELRRIYEWQMVRGINLLCQHLEGYSLRGIRKRDFPPAMFYQQPWWDEYKLFNDGMSRIGMLLTEGEVSCDVLLIHPQTTAWTLFDNDKNEGLDELNQQFLDVIKALEEKHIEFHLGDETIIQRHGSVEGNSLFVGNTKYSKVVVLPDTVLFENTKKLLDEYKLNGGLIVTIDDIEKNDIIDNKNITYTKRKYNEFTLHYFVNSTNVKQKAYIKRGSKYLDIITGDLHNFNGDYEFHPYESLVVIDDFTDRKKENDIVTSELSLDGEWNITNQTPNVLTLDFCKYSFDGVIQEENGYVLNIQQKACDLKRPVKIKQEYIVNSEYIPSELYLVIETPEIFQIKVNGISVEKTDCGYFVDNAFRKIDISKQFKCGENLIEIICEFSQLDTVYENIEKSKIFESEKNKLTYDMEIEPIYLVGDFSVKTQEAFEKLDKNAVRVKGNFYIDKPAKCICLNNIEQQGYPFFAGKITVEKSVNVNDLNKKIVFNKKGVNAIGVKVNEKAVGTVIWNPTEIDVSKFLKIGKNKISLTIVNNLRNMMGPHHVDEGESLAVTPATFFKEKILWDWELVPSGWNDDYCFVETGVIE